jgi:predicted site-specific integrase-resolvase
MKRAAKIEKVAVYARVSTKDGRQDTEKQLIALRDYCSKQGWEIAGEYVDHETGGTSKRPHFQKMFADARARKFDLVLFWSLRFYEATRDVEALRKVLGHSNLRTIQKYVHVSQDHVDGAMKIYEATRGQSGANASTQNGKTELPSANDTSALSRRIQ